MSEEQEGILELTQALALAYGALEGITHGATSVNVQGLRNVMKRIHHALYPEQPKPEGAS